MSVVKEAGKAGQDDVVEEEADTVKEKIHEYCNVESVKESGDALLMFSITKGGNIPEFNVFAASIECDL